MAFPGGGTCWSVCAGVPGGVCIYPVPLVGVWVQVERRWGSSQSWCVTSPWQWVLYLWGGQSEPGEAVSVCDHYWICLISQIHLFLKHLVCLIISYRRCDLLVTMLVLSQIQYACVAEEVLVKQIFPCPYL